MSIIFYKKYNSYSLSVCERILIHDKESEVLTLLTYKKYFIVLYWYICQYKYRYYLSTSTGICTNLCHIFPYWYYVPVFQKEKKIMSIVAKKLLKTCFTWYKRLIFYIIPSWVIEQSINQLINCFIVSLKFIFWKTNILYQDWSCDRLQEN